MSGGTSQSGLGNIGPTLVSARSLDEYVAMFRLTDLDLGGSVLDCPGGAASFTAEARRAGVAATAVDPMYAAEPRWLAEHAVDEAVRGNRHAASSVESFVWTFFADVSDHLTKRTAAARAFGHDLIARPASYVAGALPMLPFRDRSFELVLSSHLLFMYADRLDGDFHAAAALELARVAQREVRIFPLIGDPRIDTGPIIDVVTDAVEAVGCTTAVRSSSYEFQRGGYEMLIILPPGP